MAIAVALLVSFGFLPGIISSQRASAQAVDEITQREFDNLIDDAQAADPDFGPEEGDLEMDPEQVTFFPADVEPADFLAVATFENPYAASTGQFDIGIQFRANDEGFLRFIVLSDGTYALTDGTENVLANDTYDSVDDARRGENTLIVYAEAEIVHLGINGDYIGSFEVPYEAEGLVSVGTSFLGDSFLEGEVTPFFDFSVWELSGSNIGPNDDPTEEAEETPDVQIDGTLYESQNYGYTLVYSDDWEETDNVSEEGFDDLELSNGVSTLSIIGTDSRDTPGECIETYLGVLDDNADVSNVEVLLSVDDEELRGESDIDAYIVISLTFEATGGAADLTSFYYCAVIEEGVSLLEVNQIVDSADYNDEIEARTAILDSIDFDGGSGNGAEETPAADETAVSDLPEGSVSVYLEPLNDGSVTVLGTLIPDGNDTEVSLFVLLAEPDTEYLVTISDGTCTRPGDVLFDVGSINSDGFLEEVVEESVEELSNGDYIMLVTDDVSGDEVACGDLSALVE